MSKEKSLDVNKESGCENYEEGTLLSPKAL